MQKPLDFSSTKKKKGKQMSEYFFPHSLVTELGLQNNFWIFVELDGRHCFYKFLPKSGLRKFNEVLDVACIYRPIIYN